MPKFHAKCKVELSEEPKKLDKAGWCVPAMEMKIELDISAPNIKTAKEKALVIYKNYIRSHGHGRGRVVVDVLPIY